MKNCYLADKKVTVQLLKKIILIIEQIKKLLNFLIKYFKNYILVMSLKIF